MAITFQNQEVKFRLLHKTKLKHWMAEVIKREKKVLGEINFVFMTDEVLLQNNIQFLNHNTYTDIITFDSCEGEQINGDILISVDRVKENAIKFKVPFETELKRVIIHGVLHLCGYNDKRKKDQVQMRTKENLALKKWKTT